MANARILTALICSDSQVEFDKGEIVEALWCHPQTGNCSDSLPSEPEEWELHLQNSNGSRSWEFDDYVTDDVEIVG